MSSWGAGVVAAGAKEVGKGDAAGRGTMGGRRAVGRRRCGGQARRPGSGASQAGADGGVGRGDRASGHAGLGRPAPAACEAVGLEKKRGG
jgi:hypothetical protein